jgi:hypothetical protein
MGVLLTFIAGLVIWIVLWSIGAALRIISPFLPGNQPERD